jgi:tetratricopeptide (TPR) repeat protein
MHELLRQYAEERLAQSAGRGRSVRDRHTQYYLAGLERWERELKGPHQRAALLEMDQEIENARAAWTDAVACGQRSDLSLPTEALAYYLLRRGRTREGSAAFETAGRHLQSALRAGAPTSRGHIRALVRVLGYQALFRQSTGQSAVARHLLSQAWELLSSSFHAEADTRREEAQLSYVQGLMGRYTGEEDIKGSFQNSLAACRSLGDAWGTARALRQLGLIHNENGDIEPAALCLRESAAISRQIQDPFGVAEASRWLSWHHVFASELEEGERAARDALAGLRALRDRSGEAEALVALASALMWSGRYEEALQPVRERIGIRKGLGGGDCFGTHFLSWISIHQGRYGEAGRHIDVALEMAREIGAAQLIADSMHHQAHLRIAGGDYPEAVKLIEEAAAAYRKIGQEQSVRVGQCLLAVAARELGDSQRAVANLREAAQTALARRAYPTLAYTLPVAALLVLDTGRIARAAEVWASASTMACVANSRWFQDVIGRPIAAAVQDLPATVLTEVRCRGRRTQPRNALQAAIDDLDLMG